MATRTIVFAGISAGFMLAVAGTLAAQKPGQAATPPPAPGTYVMGQGMQQAPAQAPKTPAPAADHLPDPPASRIPFIVQAFTDKEKIFRDMLAHRYTYTESIDVREMDEDGQLLGRFQQVNDIQYSLERTREVVCTYCPQANMTDVQLEENDINDFFDMDMYTVDPDHLEQYNITYIDHEPLDKLNVYVFQVAPKPQPKAKKDAEAAHIFSGRLYVDDRDLMIVKSSGKAPDKFDKKGQLTSWYPPFEVWRQEIDGKYWFPVYMKADSAVPHGFGNVAGARFTVIIQFTNYKQFGSTAQVIGVQTLPDGGTTPPPAGTNTPGTTPATKPAAGGGGGGER